MSFKNFTAKSIIATILMELIICGITAFLAYQFAAGVIISKQRNEPVPGLSIFCLVMAVLCFIGLNILMIWFIKRAQKR